MERLVLGVFVGEVATDLARRTDQGKERSPDMTITFAMIQTVGKLPRDHHQCSCDGVEHE